MQTRLQSDAFDSDGRDLESFTEETLKEATLGRKSSSWEERAFDDKCQREEFLNEIKLKSKMSTLGGFRIKNYDCTMCQEWQGDRDDGFRIHFNADFFSAPTANFTNDGKSFVSSFEEVHFEKIFCYGEQEVEEEEHEVEEEEGDDEGVSLVECWLCEEKLHAGDQYRDHLAEQHFEDTALDDDYE